MKLLVLLITLGFWYIKPLRGFGSSLNFITFYLRLGDKLFGERSWYQQKTGLMVMLFFAAIVLEAFIEALNQNLILMIVSLILQAWLLFSIIQKIINTPLTMLNPVSFPEIIDQKQVNAVPDRVWQQAYFWVAPLFWYFILGIFGVVIYGIVVVAQAGVRFGWRDYARILLEMLTWIPSRLLAFAYVVVGQFSVAIKVLNQYLATGFVYNQFILKRCFIAATKEGASHKNLQRDATIFLLGIYGILAILGWFL